jgi:hypothetical protein
MGPSYRWHRDGGSSEHYWSCGWPRQNTQVAWMFGPSLSRSEASDVRTSVVKSDEQQSVRSGVLESSEYVPARIAGMGVHCRVPRRGAGAIIWIAGRRRSRFALQSRFRGVLAKLTCLCSTDCCAGERGEGGQRWTKESRTLLFCASRKDPPPCFKPGQAKGWSSTANPLPFAQLQSHARKSETRAGQLQSTDLPRLPARKGPVDFLSDPNDQPKAVHAPGPALLNPAPSRFPRRAVAARPARRPQAVDAQHVEPVRQAAAKQPHAQDGAQGQPLLQGPSQLDLGKKPG